MKVDRTYKDTWETRDKSLLGKSYRDFLKSSHWKKVKAKTLRRKKYSKCKFCGSTKNIELHHSNYKWLGTKDELRSVIPLCRTHHQEVHDLAKAEGISVRIATNKLNRIYTTTPKQPK